MDSRPCCLFNIKLHNVIWNPYQKNALQGISCKSITTTILRMPHFLVNFILILQPNILYQNRHPHASYNVKLFNWVIVYRPQHNILLNNSNSLERQANFPFWKRAARTAVCFFSSSVLCKDKLDSVLIRLKEEVQKYVNHVLQLQGSQQQGPAWIQMGSYKRWIREGRESLLCKELCFRRAAETTCSFPCRQAGNSTKIMGHLTLQVTSSSQGRQGGSHLLDQILC